MSCLRGKLGLSILLFGNVRSFAITGSVIRLFLSRTVKQGPVKGEHDRNCHLPPLSRLLSFLRLEIGLLDRYVWHMWPSVSMCVCVGLCTFQFQLSLLDKVNDICCSVFYRAHFSYWLFCDSHVVLTSLCTLPAVVGAINKNPWCRHVATKLTLEGCNLLSPICHQEEAATMLTTDVAIYCHQVATQLRLQLNSCHQVAIIVPPAWLTSSLIATTGGRFVLHQEVLEVLFKNASKYLHMSLFSHANNCPCECYH